MRIVESSNRPERRDTARQRVAGRPPVTLWVQEGAQWTKCQAQIADRSARGMGLLSDRAVPAGQTVMLEGDGLGRKSGRICWCRGTVDGRYRLGIRLAVVAPGAHDSFVDYYEVMELSANASPETVHRIYRILAQRLHPDNPDTGTAEGFQGLAEAYKVLSDPERRAAFDGVRSARRREHWKVFDQSTAMPSVEQERAKRRGVLKALYLKRLREPASPGLGLIELETLLQTPREHLEFTMWVLKEHGWATKTDGGRYSITVKGVEEAEREVAAEQPRTEVLQLEAAY